jgi:hypothetical protein
MIRWLESTRCYFQIPSGHLGRVLCSCLNKSTWVEPQCGFSSDIELVQLPKNMQWRTFESLHC